MSTVVVCASTCANTAALVHVRSECWRAPGASLYVFGLRGLCTQFRVRRSCGMLAKGAVAVQLPTITRSVLACVAWCGVHIMQVPCNVHRMHVADLQEGWGREGGAQWCERSVLCFPSRQHTLHTARREGRGRRRQAQTGARTQLQPGQKKTCKTSSLATCLAPAAQVQVVNVVQRLVGKVTVRCQPLEAAPAAVAGQEACVGIAGWRWSCLGGQVAGSSHMQSFILAKRAKTYAPVARDAAAHLLARHARQRFLQVRQAVCDLPPGGRVASAVMNHDEAGTSSKGHGPPCWPQRPKRLRGGVRLRWRPAKKAACFWAARCVPCLQCVHLHTQMHTQMHTL